MIIREHYMAQIRPFYESDLVKIITGIRRCGKSVILRQVLNELEAIGKRCLFLDFDLRPVRTKIPNADALISYVNDYLGEDKLYVFLDEVQNVEGWNEAARTLRLYNTSVFITGSNSKLLSREFTKELSGRYVSFRIRPFVYREAKEYVGQLGRSFEVSDYLVWGGFPAALEQQNKESMKRYRTISTTPSSTMTWKTGTISEKRMCLNISLITSSYPMQGSSVRSPSLTI